MDQLYVWRQHISNIEKDRLAIISGSSLDAHIVNVFPNCIYKAQQLNCVKEIYKGVPEILFVSFSNTLCDKNKTDMDKSCYKLVFNF